jgi:hypothetical protein
MAVEAVVTHDPVSRSLLAKVKTGSYAGMVWRRGHAAMMQSGGRSGPIVYAHSSARRELARGEAVVDGWLRFTFRDDKVYRELSSTPGLYAIATMDRRTEQILSDKFLA